MGAGQSSSLSGVGRGTELRPHDHSLRPGSATYHLGVLELDHPCPTLGGTIHIKRCPQSTTKESQGPRFPNRVLTSTC